MAAITNAFNLEHAGRYAELQHVPPGGVWRESFWVQYQAAIGRPAPCHDDFETQGTGNLAELSVKATGPLTEIFHDHQIRLV